MGISIDRTASGDRSSEEDRGGFKTAVSPRKFVCMPKIGIANGNHYVKRILKE